MSLQSIINVSSSLTINRRKLVGVQYTRSQLPKTDLTVTKNPWRFVVEVPGLPWSDMRSVIETLDNLDRYVPQTFTFSNNPKISWMFRYQGDFPVTPTGITVSSFVGNQITLSNLPSMPNNSYLFRAGDVIQIVGYPYPFTIVNDVQMTGSSSLTMNTHRPNIINNSVSGLSVNVGANCVWYMFCPNMPTYTITPGAVRLSTNTLSIINNGIVNFDTPFELYEYLA